MVEQVVVEDMVDYIVKLNKEMDRRGIHPSYQMNIFGLFVFHQFNATRNDTAMMFNQIMKQFEKFEKKEDK